MWLIPASISSVFAPGQACSMREFAVLFPTRGLWVTSNGKPSLRPFSWPGWARRAWSQHLFGAHVLKSSSRPSGAESWIASQQASRASLGALREISTESKTSAGSGQPSRQLSARSSPRSYFLRMCQASFLDEDSIAYSEILPRWGSMRSGVIWPQPTWEPAITASGSSFWPSTRAEDAESCGNHPNGSSDSLTGLAQHWPTPTTAPEAPNERSNQVNGPTSLGEATTLWQTPTVDNFRSRGGNRHEEMGLDRETRFWPTPIEDNANNCGGPSRSREGAYTDLTVAVNTWPSLRPCSGERSGGANRTEFYRIWPTATARDWKGSTPQCSYRSHLDQASEQIFSHPAHVMSDGANFSLTSRGSRRRLNPAFAAWLMGMPWFWTNPAQINSAQSEMQLWRCRLRWRFVCLVRDCSVLPAVAPSEETHS